MTWQTMDTAPRDGTLVELVNMDLNVGPRTMRWEDGRWIDERDRIVWHDGNHASPTHWRQLETDTAAYLESEGDAT